MFPLSKHQEDNEQTPSGAPKKKSQKERDQTIDKNVGKGAARKRPNEKRLTVHGEFGGKKKAENKRRSPLSETP